MSHLDVWAVRVCLSGGGTVGLVTVLDAMLAVYPVLCSFADRLAFKLGETTTGVRGGTTQYSIGKPSKYGMFATMASAPCTTHNPQSEGCVELQDNHGTPKASHHVKVL